MAFEPEIKIDANLQVRILMKKYRQMTYGIGEYFKFVFFLNFLSWTIISPFKNALSIILSCNWTSAACVTNFGKSPLTKYLHFV